MSDILELNRILEYLKLIDRKIDLVTEAIAIQKKEQQLFGMWISEKELIKLTGLSRNTLLKLRKEGRITRSTISGKKNYYRLSDFKRILDENEGKEVV